LVACGRSARSRWSCSAWPNRWDTGTKSEPRPKAEILAAWDRSTAALDEWFPQIPPERFLQEITAFGQYTGTLHDLLLYVIDNEIHHRGQGYVYLRALGGEPPQFFDRA
jgi:uncharacterized damage-inducible protein DinB